MQITDSPATESERNEKETRDGENSDEKRRKHENLYPNASEITLYMNLKILQRCVHAGKRLV